MAELPDLGTVKEVYALFRDELPGGKIAAPLLLVLLWCAAMLWAAGFMWRDLVSPLLTFATGVSFQGPVLLTHPILDPAPVIVSTVICLMMFWGTGKAVRKQIQRLHLKMEEFGAAAILYQEERQRLEAARAALPAAESDVPKLDGAP